MLKRRFEYAVDVNKIQIVKTTIGLSPRLQAQGCPGIFSSFSYFSNILVIKSNYVRLTGIRALPSPVIKNY